MEEGAERSEVDVDDAVGLGEQACGLWRGLGAEEDGQCQQEQDCGDDEERSSGASAHAWVTGGIRKRLTLPEGTSLMRERWCAAGKRLRLARVTEGMRSKFHCGAKN